VPRLVCCHFCHVLQRMPDVPDDTPKVPYVLEYTTGERYVVPDDEGFPQMVPAYDPVLEDFVEKHDHGMPDTAVTHSQLIESWQVDAKTWEAMDVVSKIKSELQSQRNEVYEETDEYKDAALRCYNAHGNPDLSTGCRDYMNDDRRIGRATYDDGDGHTITVPPKFRQYLCYLCPYQQSVIQVELRRKRGLYDDNVNLSKRAKARRRHRR
jgi:hypothetical protein